MLGIHQWVFSPLASASSVSSCILQAERELEESTTRIIHVLLMFHVAEELCAHPEQGSPERATSLGLHRHELCVI